VTSDGVSIGGPAISGDVVVAGASGDDSFASDAGSAYLFRTSDGGATYAEIAKLTASDGAAEDRFGQSVAIDGDTVVIGAYQDDDGGSASGSAYVFRTSDGGATYDQVAKLTASDAASNDFFGCSVAIAGDTIVVGARQYNNGGSGVAYVFEEESGWWDYFSSDAAARALPSAMILLAAAAVLAAILA